MITTAAIFTALYLILIRIFTMGWNKIDVFRPQHLLARICSPCAVESKDTGREQVISVVVACKNEEKNLPNLIKALKAQTYQNFELILVNDHSTDRTEEIIQENLQFFKNAILINSQGKGKKSALAEGIERALGNLIITTDADCIPSKKWIETIAKFHTDYSPDLIVCPVKLSNKQGFFARLQQIEFASLAASTAGAVGAQMPIMCNGANLAFTKSAWLESWADLKPEEPSGDDIFLLQSIKKRGGNICFLRSEKAFVETKPSENLRTFIRQRRRWAGKSTAYTDWQAIAAACVVFGVCLAQLMLLAFAFTNKLYLYFFLLFFALKFWADTKFLHSVSGFFSLKSVFFYSLCLSVIYPFYVVFTALSSVFFKSKRW